MTISIGIGLAIAAAARAGSTPVGLLPAGPTSTTITAPGQLVAIALPRARRTSGFVWRLARAYDTRIVREISEADVGTDLVLVFKIVGRGRTALVFALTRGDTSAKAVQSTTHRIRSA
ncbi:MAG TPA: hypothetical protein VFA66_04930 [Gaiellaceae bacterium]|nr:hypothetical protein [Gaiellaceae bacterium]